MQGHDGLIADLAAQLDAAWARSEEHAARDLASSLQNDADLPEQLTRRGCRVVTPRGESTVELVGTDHVVTADDHVIPFGYALFHEWTGPAPSSSAMTFVERMRSWTRTNACVTVDTALGPRIGRLRAVAADHIALVTDNGVTHIPLPSVRDVKRVNEGSAGAL